jgi:ribosomal protein S18 acetylase RimI-like enzyme
MHPKLILKTHLDKEDIKCIKELEAQCKMHDKTALKLELEYKESLSENSKPTFGDVHEIMYFEDNKLVGYLGIGCFGSFEPELNGMVHPDYRKKGIFTRLFRYALHSCIRMKYSKMLLLTDRDSLSGSAFIKGTNSLLDHSEYEMYLNMDVFHQLSSVPKSMILRKATNADTEEIARQNAIYFACPIHEVERILPEEEEKRGMSIFIAEVNSTIVGKIHLALYDGVGSIYGLGILENYRGKGYGKQLLNLGVKELLFLHADKIFLQVEAENESALNLYKTSGFYVTSTMDYYLKEEER